MTDDRASYLRQSCHQRQLLWCKPSRLAVFGAFFLAFALSSGVVPAPAAMAQLLAVPKPPGATEPEIPYGKLVQEIRIRGNARVESDAIVALLKTRKGAPLKLEQVQEDLKTLFDLGYFSDIRLYAQASGAGILLNLQVVEKPAITAIAFEGNEEITEDNLKDKLETKLYTIVNEVSVMADVRMIEKQYAEKGFYLAKVTYTLDKKSANEVTLTFHIDEGSKILVGSLEILGNKYFTTTDLLNGNPPLACRPATRSSAFGSSSIYQEDFVKRDLEVIGFVYKDNGFAEVKVARPFQFIDSDREFVRLTFQVEEGLQYNVESLDISGDLLFPKAELIEAMKLKPGELFRLSRLQKDVEMLSDKYGDLGYAYVDVNPKTVFDREKRLIRITYDIIKGEKVYFGKMSIIGNTKTRDNVIRREFEVSDSELYSGTKLTNSKANINRLGFFEEIQIIKERDENQQGLLNLNVKVKEKPTGQLQAAIGFSPSTSTGGVGSQWFGQGRYDEKNQSGMGLATNLTAKWNGAQTYTLELGFTNPRVNDSKWLTGANTFYMSEQRRYIDDAVVVEKKVGGSVFVGRTLFEQVQGIVTYRIQRITRDTGDTYELPRFIEQGIASSAIFTLRRQYLDNNIDPSEGTDVSLTQNFTGGPILRGDEQYLESGGDAIAYLPLDISDTFRTYFKIHSNISYIYPFGGKKVPFSTRYRLGGFSDLRGFDFTEIGPKFRLLKAPSGPSTSLNKGGDKRLYGQFEYFIPLIPEAGIKAMFFVDAGRVYDDHEAVALTGMYRDLGFGFRWVTPIAPFRFEWAYPVVDGKLGDQKVIFYIGM